MQFFKRIVIIAKNNGWIKADPFANYKIRIKKVDRGYLSQEEVEAIMAKKFSTKRLEQVRDIFIFSCFCGLAYIDVKNLRESNIRTSFDGELWIMGKREKTDVSFTIPLLEVPKKYAVISCAIRFIRVFCAPFIRQFFGNAYCFLSPLQN